MPEKATETTVDLKSCKLITCVCKHEGQDEMYGKGKRVFNPAPSKKAFRCTVCGSIREK